jgi:hypothetical protein
MTKIKSLLRAIILLSLVSVTYFAKKEGDNDLYALNSANTIFIPGLIEKLADVDNIVLTKNNQRLEFFRENDVWYLANKYPVNNSLINNLLLEICNFKLLDKKTSNADNFDKLDLGDDNSLHLLLRSSQQEEILNLLIGKATNVIINEELMSKIFVRHTDNNQAFLVLGKLDCDLDLKSWIEQPLKYLSSTKDIRKVTIVDKNYNKAVFLRGAPEGSFALINKEHNFNHAKLHNFLSDLLAIECQDVVPKTQPLPVSSTVLGLGTGYMNNSTPYYLFNTERQGAMQITIETFNDVRYTFNVRTMGDQVMAQIESNFVRQFPNEYPMVMKPIQQTLSLLTSRKQYLFKLNEEDFNAINKAQGEILND